MGDATVVAEALGVGAGVHVALAGGAGVGVGIGGAGGDPQAASSTAIAMDSPTIPAPGLLACRGAADKSPALLRCSNRSGRTVLLPVRVRSGSNFDSIIMSSNLVRLALPPLAANRRASRFFDCVPKMACPLPGRAFDGPGRL